MGSMDGAAVDLNATRIAGNALGARKADTRAARARGLSILDILKVSGEW